MEKFGIIYKITNLINNKIYIGQTVRTLKHRWARHLHPVCKSNVNAYISRAIKKYGKTNFSIEEVCTCFSREELDKQEIYFINKYNARIPGGYNICIGGKGISGFKHSDKSKKLMSELAKNRKNRAEIIKDQAGNIYSSITEAAEKLNLKLASISAVLRGHISSIKGFTFDYIDNSKIPFKFKQMKTIQDQSGNVYKSIREASRKTGVPHKTLGRIVKSGRTSPSYPNWSFHAIRRA